MAWLVPVPALVTGLGYAIVAVGLLLIAYGFYDMRKQRQQQQQQQQQPRPPLVTTANEKESSSRNDILDRRPRYVPFPKRSAAAAKHAVDPALLVVDCSLPNANTYTHHKGQSTPTELKRDSSGEIVLAAIEARHPWLAHCSQVTVNHFDIDAFVSVWACLYPQQALERKELLAQVSTIGDFRELDLTKPFTEHALKVCCWLNTEERERFFRPFGGDELEGSPDKFEFFLPRFLDVLDNIESHRKQWEEEYNQVMDDLKLLNDGNLTNIQRYPSIGLVVVSTPRPVHYYALFSFSIGLDIVVAMYDDQRYEIEQKYTMYVDFVSRPVFPRVRMDPLVRVLQDLESSGHNWVCDSFTDSGPACRLIDASRRLSKAERYANPFDRMIVSSSISPQRFSQEVLRFFQFAYEDVAPKNFWTWKEMHTFNRSLDWKRYSSEASSASTGDGGDSELDEDSEVVAGTGTDME